MQKATPAQMKICLKLVENLKEGGIRFVPIPVLDDVDFKILIKILSEKLLHILEKIKEKEEK